MNPKDKLYYINKRKFWTPPFLYFVGKRWNILCSDCVWGDDVTPEGVAHYCCENNDTTNWKPGTDKYKKIEEKIEPNNSNTKQST